MAEPPHSPGRVSILIVGNGSELYTRIAPLLSTNNYTVERAASADEGDRCFHNGLIPRLVFLDMDISGNDSLRTVEKWRNLYPASKLVAFSTASDPRTIVRTIKAGAVDYVTKPYDETALTRVLREYLADKSIRGAAPAVFQTENINRNTQIEELGNRSFFMAATPSMKQIRSQAALIAMVDMPVIVLGESGVGKEIVVRLIHKLSRRANKPFLKINCAALPADLLESELFGYEKGAFTGAVRSKPGKFELCDKGAILLDEIGEMSPTMQAKLLHVLQDGQYSRLGGRLNIRPDVCIYATTNIDMEKAIAGKTFREDLYYRLGTFIVNVPPLRERRAEIPLLFDGFMSRWSHTYGQRPLEYSEALDGACMRHPWPGNLRELENFVRRYIVLRDEKGAVEELADRSSFGAEPSFSQANGWETQSAALKPQVRRVVAAAEAQAIAQALQATHGNAKAAAAHLQISYKALLYKMKRSQLRASPSLSTEGRVLQSTW